MIEEGDNGCGHPPPRSSDELFPPVELRLEAPKLDLSGVAAPRVDIQPHTEELLDTGNAFVMSRREEIERSQARLREAVVQLEAAKFEEERALGQQVARVQGEYRDRLARLEAQFRRKAEELRAEAATEVERERAKSQRALQVKTMALTSVVGGRPSAAVQDPALRRPEPYDPAPRPFRRSKEVPPPPPGLRARLRGQARDRSDESGSSSDEAPPHVLRRGKRQPPPAPTNIPHEAEPGVAQKPAAGRAQRPLRIAQLLTDSEDEEW